MRRSLASRLGFSLALALTLTHCAAARPAPSGATAYTVSPRAPSLEQLFNVHRAFGVSPSRDGRTLAFLSDAPGLAQVFTVRLEGDATPPIAEARWTRRTRIDDRVQFVHYAPDERFLYFGADHGGDENIQLFRMGAAQGDPTALTNLPRVKHMFGAMSRDGRFVAYASNERSPGDFDVYVAPVDQSAPPRRVLEASGHHEAVAFSPDGSQLIVQHERSNFDNDLLLVTVAGTHPPVALTTHQGDQRFYFTRFSSDGRSLVLASDRGRDVLTVSRMELSSGTVTALLDEPHDADLLELSADGRTLAVAYNVDGWTDLRLFDASDLANLRPLARPELARGVVTAMEFSGDGATLALTVSRATAPDEVYTLDVRTGHVRRITESDHAGLDEGTLAEPTVERARSFDGLEVPMLVYRPRVSPINSAAIVLVHGGPEGQAVPRFNPLVQYLVGRGYTVVEPNVRGSTGYGNRYAHLDDVRRREDSVRDLAAVNQWLRAQPGVDAGRIAVMGGSYGGYMTLAAITRQPELWAAACDIVGIANFRTFLERTAAYRRALREAEYGSLANDGAFLDEISPLRRVGEIRAPLFVIHGANDPRVPVTEAEQIVNALRARRHRVEYLRFENEGHGLARRENKLRAYPALAAFFEQTLLRR